LSASICGNGDLIIQIFRRGVVSAIRWIAILQFLE
jgi:hypothetical protein